MAVLVLVMCKINTIVILLAFYVCWLDIKLFGYSLLDDLLRYKINYLLAAFLFRRVNKVDGTIMLEKQVVPTQVISYRIMDISGDYFVALW